MIKWQHKSSKFGGKYLILGLLVSLLTLEGSLFAWHMHRQPSTLGWMGFTAPVIRNYSCVHVVLLEMAWTSCMVSWNHKHFLLLLSRQGVGVDSTLHYLGVEELACFNLMRIHTSLSFPFHQYYLQPQFQYWPLVLVVVKKYNKKPHLPL